MGLYKEAARRILRTKWRSVQAFAQEVYAILSEDVQLRTEQPIVITQKPGQPAITIIQTPDATVPPVVFTRQNPGDGTWEVATPDGTTGTVPPQATPPFTGYPIDLPTFPDGSGGGPGGGGRVMLGVVTSGSEATYNVTVYPNGTSAGGESVVATVPQIAEGEAVPSGTWVTVVRNPDGTHEFQPVVWQRD